MTLMDSKTKAEYRITPGWHSIDEQMQTNAEHRNLIWAFQNKIKERQLCVLHWFLLGFSPWYLNTR